MHRHVDQHQGRPDGGILFSGSMTAASGKWTQKDPAKKKWNYKDTASPPAARIRTAQIKEVLVGSDAYDFKMTGKSADIRNAPLAPATDDLKLTIEIEPSGGGSCFEYTLNSCVNNTSGTKQTCSP
jgi:hypothetical protein